MKARCLVLFLFILPFTGIAQLPTYRTEFCLPLHHLKLTSNFGYRIHPLSGRWAFHSGIDLSARSDTVFCILDGVVRYTGYNARIGIYIKVDHGGNLQSVYGHLSVPWVCKADTLYAGQPIGMTGKTGWVTGEHLHFSILSNNRHLNPLTFLKALVRRELLTK